MSSENKIPEDKLDEFVKRVRAAAGQNIDSIILFGSAVSGDFNSKHSDLNLFCVLRDSSFASLQTLSPAVKWWIAQKQPPPQCMTRRELQRSTDVFTIELLDMVRHHRVLFGDDVLQGLQISTRQHRAQVEYELREKLLLLRQHLLVADGDDSRLWDVLVRSAPSFATLCRHGLIAIAGEAPPGRAEAIRELSKQMGVDLTAIEQVLGKRDRKPGSWEVKERDLCAPYLAAIEKVADAVDQALDSETSSR